jgi:hypothetical protein
MTYSKNQLDEPIEGLLAERNIFSLLCLFVMTSPVILFFVTIKFFCDKKNYIFCEGCRLESDIATAVKRSHDWRAESKREPPRYLEIKKCLKLYKQY